MIYVVLCRTCPMARQRRAESIGVTERWQHASPTGAWSHHVHLALEMNAQRPAPEEYVIVRAVEDRGGAFVLDWTETHDPQGLPEEIAAARRDDA